MVRVEVILENRVEIHNVPMIAGLSWPDANILAMQFVYDDLLRRDICLAGLQMSARNPEFNPMRDKDLDWSDKMEYEIKQDGTLELKPLTKCLWCLSADHLLADCSEKHDLFALNGNDETFLRECGIWFPRWIDQKFVSDPYESEEIQ